MARTSRRRDAYPSPASQPLGKGIEMNRRDMLKAGIAAGTLGLAPRLASAQVDLAPAPKGWRTFVLTTRVEPTLAPPRRGSRCRPSRPTTGSARATSPGRAMPRSPSACAIPSTAPRCCASNGRPTSRRRWSRSRPRCRRRTARCVPGQGNAAPLSDAERKLNLAGHRAAADRRPGARRPPQDIVKGKTGRRRQGARALRMGGREHLPQRQDAGCGVGDVSCDDQDRQPQRQVRRPERAVRRHGPLGRPAGARRLRHPRRAVGVRLQVAGRRQRRTSPRRSIAAPRSGCRAAAGRRSIRPTCARSCSRSRRPTSP